MAEALLRGLLPDVPVRVRHSPRGRRLTLRVQAPGEVVLVLPSGVAPALAERFLRERIDWVRDRLAGLPRPVPFADGALVPLLDRPHRVRHRADARGTVWRVETADGPELHVAGAAEHLPRRLADWLRAEARRELQARAAPLADRVQRRITAVTVRDTRSRWGSCSHTGRLSFSWRLVLAPEAVLDYVVAHEVAHLVEFGHTPEFWRLVDRLTPHRRSAQAWLRRRGTALHAYGAPVRTLPTAASGSV